MHEGGPGRRNSPGERMADGVKLAEKVIDTGLAKAQLERFIKLSNA